MNALETKVSNMIYNFRKENGINPTTARCTIRWNDDKTYVKSQKFALDGLDDDDIFFVLDTPSELYKLIANIDFTIDDFQSSLEFYSEVDKYDTDDSNNEDWTYLHRGEDFCIVDIEWLY